MPGGGFCSRRITPRSVDEIGRSSPVQSATIECCAKPGEPLDPPVTPVGELVVPAPALGREHRPHEGVALVNQGWISPRIVVPNLVGDESEVVLDRSAATRREVYEKRPSPRAEHVARVGLPVQQLLASGITADGGAQAAERGADEFPVGIEKLWSLAPLGNQDLPTRDVIGEPRCLKIHLPKVGVELYECVRIVGRCDVRGGNRLIVGPQRDSEVVTTIHARLYPRIKLTYRAIGVGQTESDIDFELKTAMMCQRPDPGENIAREQAHRDSVRVVNDDRIGDVKSQLGGSRRCGLHPAPDFGSLHRNRRPLVTGRCLPLAQPLPPADQP